VNAPDRAAITAAVSRLTAICEYVDTYGKWPRTRAAKRDANDLRGVLAELARVTALADDNVAMDLAERNEELRDQVATLKAGVQAQSEELAAYRARAAEAEQDLRGYKIAADDEADMRAWPTVVHLPCGAPVFGQASEDADDIDGATLLRLLAAHRCVASGTAAEEEEACGAVSPDDSCGSCPDCLDAIDDWRELNGEDA